MQWDVALEMAILSHAVYDDDATALREWYEDVVFIEDIASDSEAYLLAKPDMRVLAIRGSDSLRDWLSNLSICLMCREGRHKGFDQAADGLMAKPQFSEWLGKPGPIFITGHSKGGAIAQIIATKLRRVEAVFGFGSPKPGNRNFRREYRRNGTPTYLFVNSMDLIAMLPPGFLGYKHPVEPHHLDARGHDMVKYLDEVAKRN